MPHLLLTGAPGIGKSTLVRRVIETLPDRTLRGFLTEEIREQQQRVGFSIRTVDGLAATLAHVRLVSPTGVGPYRVNLAALEQIVDAALLPAPGVDLYVIDEIGKMECCSPRFVGAAERLLAGTVPVLATISQRGGGAMATLRQQPNTTLWTVTQQNRDRLPAAILQWLSAPSNVSEPSQI